MKLCEIKIEALNLMFASADDVLLPQYIQTYKNDEQYKKYLYSMIGAINRCFSDIEAKGVLLPKGKILPVESADRSGRFARFDMDEQVSDFYEIDRVIKQDESGYREIGYTTEGHTLVLPLWEEGEIRVLYRPKIPRVTTLTGENEDIGVPDEVAAAIPYYIKGDLFREDEPAEAGEARNWYEAAMAQLTHRVQSAQTQVETVYSGVI